MDKQVLIPKEDASETWFEKVCKLFETPILSDKLDDAIYKGKLKRVKNIVQNDKDVNYEWALGYAALCGKLEIVKYIVSIGINVNILEGSPLKWSASRGHFEVVKYLVENGANVNVCDDYPLRQSASNGHFEVVKYLVENGANINALNRESITTSNVNKHTNITRYLTIKALYQ